MSFEDIVNETGTWHCQPPSRGQLHASF